VDNQQAILDLLWKINYGHENKFRTVAAKA